MGLQDIKKVKTRLRNSIKEATHSSLPLSLTFLNHSWFPSPISGPLRNHSEVHLAPNLCLLPSLVDCRVTLSSFLAPISLPTPFTGNYTSLCTKRQMYKSLVCTSVFRSSESSTILVYLASPNIIGFSWYLRIEG